MYNTELFLFKMVNKIIDFYMFNLKDGYIFA